MSTISATYNGVQVNWTKHADCYPVDGKTVDFKYDPNGKETYARIQYE